MNQTDRRKFLQLIGSGAVASALPTGIARALEVPANRRTGTIDDVEHIIILTQENRSFDHYFGTMRGVRGFADPRAVKLPSGKTVWHQPYGSGELLPFRPPVDNLGLTFLPDPPHGWNDGHAAWNEGRYDHWVEKKGITSLTYHIRQDIPYHFALADAFTVCDAYHCSLIGPTDPNRYHLWTGWCGNDGNGGGPVVTNAEVGYDWMSYPERLQAAGISWKVYQDVGVGLDGPGYWGWTDDAFIGNYGDNSLLYLHQYQNAQPGTPLADFAKTGTNISAFNRDPKRLLDVFREDVRTGKLPQVSWIAAPEAFSEHPNFPADFGAWYISQFIDILAAHPEVFAKTVLFINYDEDGGFFDHDVAPTPPMSPEHGASTVDTVNEIFPGDGSNRVVAPYGLGVRVPMIVVSPWSKGGYVNSQVFDHTSVIRFLEARFARHHAGLIETNITPWRRAVAGDLTTAFDFSRPDSMKLRLPRTAAYLPTVLDRQGNYPVAAPVDGQLPGQEVGVRPARALPYDLEAHGSVSAAGDEFQIRFENTGKATAVFQVRPGQGQTLPRTYTVEPGKHLVGVWAIDASAYDLAVHGPNGFLRSFQGVTAGRGHAQVDVRASTDESRNSLALSLKNRADHEAHVAIVDRYTGETVEVELGPKATATRRWSTVKTSGWYDLVVGVERDADFQVQVAGHLENGQDSISDPAMGGVKIED